MRKYDPHAEAVRVLQEGHMPRMPEVLEARRQDRAARDMQVVLGQPEGKEEVQVYLAPRPDLFYFRLYQR